MLVWLGLAIADQALAAPGKGYCETPHETIPFRGGAELSGGDPGNGAIAPCSCPSPRPVNHLSVLLHELRTAF
jgi:hypothetical protein